MCINGQKDTTQIMTKKEKNYTEKRASSEKTKKNLFKVHTYYLKTKK